MTSPHPIQCRCGTLRGALAFPERALRLVCYCRDCQTYAHALGHAAQVIDAQGGTAIVAALQQHVSFTQGQDQLACLRLTDTGVYRWYARCCHTPLANTVGRPQMSYVGLVHSALGPDAPAVARTWPASFTMNPRHAKGPVPAPGPRALLGALRIARAVLGARVSGSWRRSPFFVAGSAQPVVAPRVLTAAELQAARAAVG